MSSRFIQAASLIALTTVTASAGAWYAPYAAPCMTQEQQETMAAQQKAMIEQQTRVMEQAAEAQRKFAEQQAAYFAQLQQTAAPSTVPGTGAPAVTDQATPMVPPMPEFSQYPALPELPPVPEFAQYPGRPDMPTPPSLQRVNAPESMEARLKEMDDYRAQAEKNMQDRRAVMKNWSEQRRAMQSDRFQGPRPHGYFPGAYRSMGSSNMECAPAASQQQASAPANQTTTTQ